MATKAKAKETVPTNGAEPVQKAVGEVLEGIKLRILRIRLTGRTPLICCRLTAEALAPKPVTPDITVKDEPTQDDVRRQMCLRHRYTMPDGRDAFPAAGVMDAAVVTGYRFMDTPKVNMRGLVSVAAEFIPIEAPESYYERTDTARNRNRNAILVYRPCYPIWAMEFDVRYWADRVSADALLTLFHMAGHAVGIGAWRKELGGTFGQFGAEAVKK